MVPDPAKGATPVDPPAWSLQRARETAHGASPDPSTYAIGCDIGVTNVKLVCAAPDGRIIAQHQADTNAAAPDWPHGVKRLIDRIELEHGPAASVGVAAPGMAAPHGRFIAWMQGRLSEVQNLDWSNFLDRGQFVPVLNDAQAALLGETWQGAAAGATNVILLTLGTGVGGAAVVDGHLLKGHLGRAGHLGHISLDPDGPPDVTNSPGSLEDRIGNCTIHRRTNGRFATTHDLIAAHRAGDPEATRVWLRSVRDLAAAVAGLVNVLDPQVVIIGGGIARAGDALFDPLNRLLDEFEWRPHGQRVRVVPAKLGEFAGALGAAWNGMREAGAG